MPSIPIECQWGVVSDYGDTVTFQSLPKQKAEERNSIKCKISRNNLFISSPTSPSSSILLFRCGEFSPTIEPTVFGTMPQEQFRIDYTVNDNGFIPAGNPHPRVPLIPSLRSDSVSLLHLLLLPCISLHDGGYFFI